MRVRVSGSLGLMALGAALLAAGELTAAVDAPRAEIVFRAVCGDLSGHRVDMSPTDPMGRARWRAELYRAGSPPQGQGTLELLSDDGHPDSIRVSWGETGRLLPVVYKSESQVSVADVDEFGVWIYSLYFRAGKIVVSRQTVGPLTGAVGALVQGDCDLRAQ